MAQMDEQNRLKGFLGTADEMTAVAEVVAPKTVEWVRSLTDAEIIPMGIKALGDIADDILVLDEIRQRFHRGAIAPYAGWKDFIKKHSKYSLRTVQRRLNEVHGVREYEKFEITEPVETTKCRLSTKTEELHEPIAAPAVITDAINFPTKPSSKNPVNAEFARLQQLAKTAGYHLATSARDGAYDLLGLTVAQVEVFLKAQS